MKPQRFRKRPVEITALRWNVDNAQQVRDWLGDAFITQYVSCTVWSASKCSVCHTLDNHIAIRTLEGQINACPGDWIICGIQGEFYPCKPDIFDDSYERVGDMSEDCNHCRCPDGECCHCGGPNGHKWDTETLDRVRAIDPADHATSSRDYGRGFAEAIRLVREALDGKA